MLEEGHERTVRAGYHLRVGRTDQCRLNTRHFPIGSLAFRLGLAHLPTPLEPMRRLTAHLGGPRLWVKREDCDGARIWRQQAAQARLRPARGHCRWRRHAGVRRRGAVEQPAPGGGRGGQARPACHLAVYHGRLAPPTPEYEDLGNALLNRLYGADLHDVPWTGDRNGAIRALGRRDRSQGSEAVFVPYGVSNPLGAVAYATTIAEIEQQAKQSGFSPSAIVHCTGSAGTQAVSSSVRRRPCPTRASLELISMPSPRGCGPTL